MIALIFAVLTVVTTGSVCGMAAKGAAQDSPTAFLEAAISGNGAKQAQAAPAASAAGVALPQASLFKAQMDQAIAAKKAAVMAAFAPKLSGFIRYDMFFDTRQVVGFRLDANHLFPFPQQLDANGKDIAAAPQLHMMAIKTNLKWSADGPTTFGARTRAVINADFSGPWVIDNAIENRPGISLSTINGFMLQEAFYKLDWCAGSLLIGQYWHPLFDQRFSSGSLMIEPIARSPQIKAAAYYRCFEASLTASGQIDFCSDGPNFYAETYDPRFINFIKRTRPEVLVADRSVSYFNNSVMPNFTFKVQGLHNKHIFGVAFDVKLLKPRLFTRVQNNAGLEFLTNPDGTLQREIAFFSGAPATLGQPVPALIVDPLSVVKTFKTDKRMASFSAMGFVGLQGDCWNLKLKGVYGENMSDHYMIGGYGVTARDVTTGAEEYTPIRSGTFLAEVGYSTKKFQATVFSGYSKNLGLRGACKELVKDLTRFNENFPNNVYDVYHFIPNMDHIFRVNGTIKILRLPIVFAGSVEYCRASFGDLTPQAKITNAKKVHSIRFLFSSYYFFK